MRPPIIWLIGLAGVLLFGVGIGGCRPDVAPPADLFGEAIVDAVEIDVLESFPLQVRAHLFGGLPDTCTRIHEVVRSREETTFTLRLITRRPSDAICAQVITPFEISVDLPIEGLPAGTYTVVAGDARAQFDLPIADASPEERE